MMNEARVTYQAIWNGAVVAESDRTIGLEGNRYFPPASVRRELLRDSSHGSVCPWKGTARYYTLEVDGRTNADAAWFYPDPSPAASQIRDHVAFWRGVRVVEKTPPDGPAEEPGAISRFLHRSVGLRRPLA
jgi:uncharacterized protein (DUF427 family)